MKKIIFTLVIAMGFLVKVDAQEIKYGIKAGVNMTDWHGDAKAALSDLIGVTQVLETKSSIGYHAGAFMSIPVSDRFFIEPSVLYSKKGMRLTESFLDGSLFNIEGEIAVNSHYIDLPVVAKYMITEGLHIYAGPQVSYLASNRLKAKAGIFGFNVSEGFDINSGFRSVDVGLTGGLGYQLENGVSISAGYDHGLTSLDENNLFNAYNRVVKASIGITF